MTSPRRRAAHIVAVLSIVLALQLVALPSASAQGRTQFSASESSRSSALRADPDSYGVGRSSYQSVCEAAGTETPADSTLLSVNRWGEVADSFHDRLDADFWSDVFEKLQRRQVFSTMMQFGNSLWQLSSGLTGFATHFCLIDVVGADSDAMTAALGDAITSSGLLAALVATAFMMVLWQTWRGAGTVRALVRPIAVSAMLVVLTVGATSSTGSSPGAASPWWWASKIEKVVSNVAAAPMKALAGKDSAVVGLADGTEGGASACSNYLRHLRDQYQATFGSGMDTLSAEVPLTMSQMWENTGLSVWIKSQFGKDNPYGAKVSCYVLDDRTNRDVGSATDSPSTAAATGGTRLGMLAGGVPTADPSSAAFNFAADDLLEDAAVVGLAACVYDGAAWSVEPGWSQIQSGGQSGGGGTAPADSKGAIAPADCEALWTEQSQRSSEDLDTWHMVYEDDPSYIDSAAKYFAAPAAGNFLANWHGNDNGAAFVLALTYDISALVMLVVFGGISVGIIVAKTMLVVMLALILIAAILSIWPGSGTSRITQFLKLYLGITLFVFAVGSLFSLINLVTAYLGKASTTLFSSGSLLSVLWFAFAPVIAVVILHMFFKHVLRMPSPFKVSGALAWGGAIAGAGGAAAAGLDRLAGRGFRPFRSMARNGAYLGMLRMRGPGGLVGRGAKPQRMRAKDNISTNVGSTPTTSASATADGQAPPVPVAAERTTAPPAHAPSPKTAAAFAKRLATSGALLDEGASSKWLRRGVSALDRRLLDPGMSQRFRQLAIDNAANGAQWLQSRVDATSRRTRYAALSATASMKDRAVLARARARRAIEWSRAHPAKTAGLIAAGGLAAINLPVAGTVAGAVGLAAGHPVLAGGAAAYALRRHRKQVSRRDPQAVAERRRQRQQSYRWEADRVLRSGRLSPQQAARWTRRIYPGGPPTPPGSTNGQPPAGDRSSSPPDASTRGDDT